MTNPRKQLGNFGEAAALGYLVRQGLCEVERNWRCSAGEIDLVLRDGATLVFVEVRTRRNANSLESVDARKQARLAALAYSYLEAQQLAATTVWRIDVVGVQISRRGTIDTIDWVRDAVEM